ncbi:MAG TPA: glycosyltransferase 9 family protein [Rhodospirillaceae bacterium]|nr:glycosyltransferase 9 family protein [Rhodospirillaceae bacterium]
MAQQNILVIKLGALGDFIYALGPMAAIRRHHPQDKITLLTTKPFVKMAESCGYFDEIILDRKPRLFDVAGWFRLRAALNAAQFSRVYDLQNNDRTALYFKLFHPKPEWVGAVKGASHRNASPERSLVHAFLGHRQTLAVGGVEKVELDSLDWFQQDVTQFALKVPYVLVVPACSAAHPEKRWPIAHFRAIIGKLILQGYQPVIIGSKEDKEINDQVTRGIEGLLNLTGKTALADIPSLAKGAVAAIGNDTGPMHMAAVAGCPVVMLFCNQTSSIKMHAPPKESGVKALEAMNLEDITPQNLWVKFQELVSESRDGSDNR